MDKRSYESGNERFYQGVIACNGEWGVEMRIGKTLPLSPVPSPQSPIKIFLNSIYFPHFPSKKRVKRAYAALHGVVEIRPAIYTLSDILDILSLRKLSAFCRLGIRITLLQSCSSWGDPKTALCALFCWIIITRQFHLTISIGKYTASRCCA